MTMKRNIRQIALNRETLRNLGDREAGTVAGGVIQTVKTCFTCAGAITCQTNRVTCGTCIPCLGGCIQ
jgi:NADH:ubiquinone oxidoreductase subunit F (NADH-binding)